MKKIEAYKTDDGEVFTSAEEARDHQARLDFAEWYHGNKLYGNVAGWVDFQDLVEWLNDHRDEVLRYLRDQ